MRYVILIVLSAFFCDSFSQAPLFIKGPVVEVPSVNGHRMAAADYDADGNPDYLIGGYQLNIPKVRIAELRDGLLHFMDVLPSGFSNGAWMDADGDGDQDVLLSYSDNFGSKAEIHLNNNGAFTKQAIALPSLLFATYWPADIDGDGDDDILMIGKQAQPNTTTKMFRNDEGTFVEIPTAIAGADESFASWIDVDNDDDLDIYISGSYGVNGRLYLNNGGIFTAHPALFPGAVRGFLSWEDIDNDDDLDLLLTGFNTSGGVAQIFINNGATFAPYTDLTLTPTEQGNSQFIDFDNDGDLDVFHSGAKTGGIFIVELHERTPTGWVTVEEHGLPSNFFNSFSFLDYDKDDDIDALALNDGFLVRFYRNQTITAGQMPDHLPAWPIDLTTHPVTSTSIMIEFRDYGDNEDYFEVEMRHGDNGTFQLLTTMPGSFNQQHTHTVGSLTPGVRYALRIRARNSAGFSKYSDTTYAYTAAVVLPTVTVAGVAINSVAEYFGDLDNDGDLDIVDGSYAIPPRLSFSINTNGSFTTQPSLIEGITPHSIDGSDFDRDGDLDLLISGTPAGEANAISRIYINGGNLSFQNAGVAILGIRSGTADWVDVNADGYDDIFVSGTLDPNNTVHANQLLINNKDNTFTEKFGHGLPPAFQSAAVWRDFDNNGYTDVAIVGIEVVGSFSISISGVYLNNGNNTFTLSQTLQGSSWITPAIAAADLNRDGTEDIVVGGAGHPTQIFWNKEGEFEKDMSNSLPAFAGCAISVGDINNDGHPDMMMGGTVGFSTRHSDVYLNNGAGLFTRGYYSLAPVSEAKYGLADIDSDGDLDMFDFANNITVHKNLNTNANARPDPPTIISQTQSGNSVKVRIGKSDDRTPENSLISNFYLKDEQGKYLFNGIASRSTGNLMVAAPGKGGLDSVITIRGLSMGTYEFGVQAIDDSFKASTFTVSTVTIEMAAPALASDTTACVMSTLPVKVDGENIEWYKDAALTVPAGQGNTLNVNIKQSDTTLYAVQLYGTAKGPSLEVRLKALTKISGPITKISGGLMAPEGTAYKWWRNDTLLVTTTREIITSIPGNYKVIVSNYGCPSEFIAALIQPAPPSITRSIIEDCAGKTQTLTATGTSIKWYDRTGAAFGSGLTKTITNLQLGDTVAFATQTINLAESEKQKSVWKVFAVPGSVISLQGSSYQAPEGISYQWFYEDVALTGATSRTLEPAEDGVYHVEVTNGPCKTTSAKVTFTEVTEQVLNITAAYNLDRQALYVSVDGSALSSIRVYDMAGRSVAQESGLTAVANGHEIAMAHTAQGLYIAHLVMVDGMVYRVKFVR